MPRLNRPIRRTTPMDRPSRLHIFARRQRHRVRPVLAGLALLVVAGFGLHFARAMRTERGSAPIRAEIARAAGLRVDDIVVEGRNMTPESQVTAALGISRGDPLLGFSLEAARLRIDRLAFVEHSVVERRLPGTVLVRISERRPFAVWQNAGRFVLIDRDGQVVESPGVGRGEDVRKLSGKDAEAFAQLPLVVGRGAPGAATALIDALQTEPEVRRQVAASVRVGQRRWNLTLRSGADVLLPEGAELPALHRLAELEADMHLLERPLVDIDMRLPDRLVVRPRPPAAPPPTDPAAVPAFGHDQDPAAAAPAAPRGGPA